jgi:hypothetical protein
MHFSDLETYFTMPIQLNARSYYGGMDFINVFEGEIFWKDLFLIDGL